MRATFFRQVAEASTPAVRAALKGLEGRVNGWLERAGAARPALKVNEARFAKHLGQHLTLEALSPRAAWLPEDLFLALACLESQPAALAELEGWLRSGQRDDEVRQRVREKLLVGPPPRLAQYAGRSALEAWVRLVMKRAAVDVQREAEPAEAPTTLAGVIRATPELMLVNADAAAHVTRALNAALEALAPKERLLLRLHYLEGRSHAEIGEQLKAPRSSVAHWIEKARVRLLAQTRSGLKRDARLDSAALDSLIGVVRSNLELSFSGLKRD